MEKKLQDFMDSVASLGIKEDDFAAVSTDGKIYDGYSFRSIMVVLADCSEEVLTDINAIDFFRRLTKVFIQNNTDENLKTFIQHHIALKMARIVGE